MFPIFLGQGIQRLSSTYDKEYRQEKDDEHTISIILSLFKSALAKEHLDRLFAKFLENQGEKTERLIVCFRVYYLRVGILEARFNLLDPETRNTDVEYLERLDAGLYTLQMISVIIAYLYSADPYSANVSEDGKFPVLRFCCSNSFYSFGSRLNRHFRITDRAWRSVPVS